MKKLKILIILILLVVIFSLSAFGIKRLISYLQVKYAKIEVTLVDDLTLNFTEERKVSDFIKTINGKIEDDYIIDSTQIGEKQVKFDFINNDGIKVSYEYTISVVDEVPPVIWLTNSYSITVGSDVDLTEKILCGDNEDEDPLKEIEGSYDYNKIGSYPLIYKATDRSGNKSEQKFTLYVNPKRNGSSNSTRTYTYFSDIVKEHKNKNTKIGLDVSFWQGDIDFNALKNAGVEFIIIRVGTANGPDGDYILDSKFINNITKANECGIDAGIYYYSYADSVEHAIADANWVLEQIKGYDINLPIAFDWENWNSFNKYKLSFFELTNMANAFVKTIEDAGYKGMLYGSKNYLESLWMPVKYDTWLAHYAKSTNYAGDYILWQLCSNGKVDGISGDVDINVMYNK